MAASAPGWQAAEFDDRAWPRVAALGAIESKAEFFQWNTDAGMYDWPGYRGMSPNLRSYSLRAMQVTHRFDGAGTLDHVDALTQATPREPFSVRPPAGTAAAGNAPALLLDFGREVAGRLLIKSGCDCEAQVVVSYGESESEALTGGHYLGTNLLRLPPHGEARGPKSGFRYAWLRFVGAAVVTAFRSIELEGIAYPVNYTGSFASSDALLNRIWETSAHTAHLCMQDGIWDAPKRDRGWWVGDLDASGPVIADIFGDSALLNETLTRLIPPSGQDVNGIPGYTALWVTTLAELYRRSGDRSLLEARHAELVKLLEKMDGELDASGRFANKDHRWLFVDWSPGLFAFTDEAREGTQLEFVRALRAGAWLLDELGDSAAAAHYTERAGALAAEMRSRFAGTDGVFGERWQLNAMAVLAGVAQERDDDAIWTRVLGAVGQRDAQAQTISPYFNGYLLQAMARMGRRREALDWMRVYWGGMLAEGATSFWEAYDLRWPKQDPHVGLQADGTSGYFVSLAHGWSSGPAAWLMEEVLGIHAESAGYRKVVIRPDLLGLEWARGQVASPRGAIGVEMRKKPEAAIEVTLPAGVEATVLVPLAHADAHVLVDGAPVAATPAEQGERAAIVLRTAGRYEITSR